MDQHPPGFSTRPRVAGALLHAGLLIGAVSLVAAGCGRPGPQVDGLPERVDFNFHVKPILSDRCFKCHGPDDAVRKAGLRFDTQDGPFTTLASGTPAIVRGWPRRSELVRRILSDDPLVMMPAPDSHLTLSEYEKAVLIKWIDQGADWKPHWAFTAPALPKVPPPAFETTPDDPIDLFVQARLAGLGMQPSHEAPKEVLIRRVTLALTGLPPTLAEVDAYLADTSPDAYERVVDRLLASPAYGERMAADWLDLARYADSHGYQDDGMRPMWPWRDWVIEAFNRNLPMDEFITWQLAGDLLPEPTREQRLATAFNRHHQQSQEGGIVPEEYRVEYVADRVDTFGKAFLGVSLECARCHDHKYDPVMQREYFELFAFFNSNNEAGQIPYSGMPSPTLLLPTPEAETKVAALREARRALERDAGIDAERYDEGFASWRAHPTRLASPPALVAHLPLDDITPRTVTERPDPKKPARTVRKQLLTNTARRTEPASLEGDIDRVPTTVAGRVDAAQRLVGDSHLQLARGVGVFDRHQPFSVSVWLRVDAKGTSGPVIARSGGSADGYRGYAVILQPDGRLNAWLHHVYPDNSIELVTEQPLAVDTWQHLAFVYDGSSRASGVRLFVDGAPAPVRVVVDNLQRSIINSGIPTNQSWGGIGSLRIGRLGEQTLQDVSVDEFRLFETTLTPVEVASLAGIEDALGSATQSALREHYVRRHAPTFAPALRALTAVRAEENELITSQLEVMVMRELPQPRPTFILARGAYDAPTDPVAPATPDFLPPFPETLPRNRLGLARWLVDPTHPLTSRVFVNRVWASLLGRGLVPTPDDFGNQGRLPSHPDLLDWLAVTFVESGWDLKALQKRIVLSATYRQSSIADERTRELDPENEWLARGPAHRLSAEQIRDTALAASGLLVPTIGGPSVYPYQPPGLWEELATRNATTYTQGTGDALYRRSLYTVWKRSTPPPSAISFDASERFACTVNRQRTSTPLQALVLMNDPQYVESARVLAEHILREGGGSPEARATYAVRRVTAQQPSPAALAALVALYDAERARFGNDRSAALGLLRTGERPPDTDLPPEDLAAWTVVASTILNLDAMVYAR